MGWLPSEIARHRGSEGFIDPNSIRNGLSFEEITAREDKLADAIALTDAEYESPFGHPEDTRETLSFLSPALLLLQLEQNHNVLVIGCGTGWLPRLIAKMGVKVTCCDFSNVALSKSRAWTAVRAPRLSSFIEYTLATKGSLNLGEKVFDRVVVSGGFGRWLNYGVVLKDIKKSLKADGLLLAIEQDSSAWIKNAAQKKMEMFGVLEQGLADQDLITALQSADLEIAKIEYVHTPVSYTLLPGEEHANSVDKSPQSEIIRRLISIQHAELAPRASGPDDELTGKIEVLSARVGEGNLELAVSVTNTGEYSWLESTNVQGGVQLGVMRVTAESEVEVDYRRERISMKRMPPGKTFSLNFVLPHPDQGQKGWILDLVSEHVKWFGLRVEIDANGRSL